MATFSMLESIVKSIATEGKDRITSIECQGNPKEGPCMITMNDRSNLPPIEMMITSDASGKISGVMITFNVKDWGESQSSNMAAGEYARIFVKEFPSTWKQFKGKTLFDMSD